MIKINRLLLFTMIAVLLCGILAVTADGEIDSSDEQTAFEWKIYYQDESQEYYEITKYNGTKTDLILASRLFRQITSYFDEWSGLVLHNIHSEQTDAIGDSAFAGSSIVTVVLEDLSTHSWMDSDYYCYWRRIGAHAFRNCKQLRSITIPSSVKEIGDGAFDGCPLLTVKVNPGSYAEQYCQENGVRYDYSARKRGEFTYRPRKDGGADLVLFTQSSTRFVTGAVPQRTLDIPSELDGYAVRRICEGAFTADGMTAIDTFVVPDTVTQIEDGAFKKYASINLVVTPGSYAEQYCKDNGIRYFYSP